MPGLLLRWSNNGSTNRWRPRPVLRACPLLYTIHLFPKIVIYRSIRVDIQSIKHDTQEWPSFDSICQFLSLQKLVHYEILIHQNKIHWFKQAMMNSIISYITSFLILDLEKCYFIWGRGRGVKNKFCKAGKCERCAAQQHKHARGDWACLL